MWILPESEIDRLIFEDAPGGDLTTAAMAIGEQHGRLALRARDAMVLAGVEVAARMMERVGLQARIETRSGARLEPGAPVLSATGSAAALHRVWKSAKNLMESLSGIATATRAMVDAVEAVAPDVRIALTRKTFPGSRVLSQLAAMAGGGIVHRAGLSETILIFAEHRAFLRDEPLHALAARMRRAAPERKIEIEVGSVAEALEAIDAGFDAIQLEKFAPAGMAAVVAHARSRQRPPLIAAAGGITPENAAQCVSTGIGLVVTSWPYAARPRDLATEFQPV
ncbi:ModD protein [Verticiella sediminum]|uniref:ModD protein n=1 Tax=Verticiella sediminum TaxID=1247510 RepID=UPI001B85FD12|nr:ModD protein [Verticiella sediminum]